LPSSSGDKLCPICDSPLQPGSKKCSFCGTDLSIFDIDVESPKPVEAPPASPPPAKPSVESRIEEIFSKPFVPERPAPAKPPKPEVTETPASPTPEPVVVQEAEPEPEPEVKVEEKKPEPAVEYFECPQCGAAVETTASSCPKCGVLFAEEGADMFQCPACNTLVSIDAKTCPGCGAVFVEPGEEPVAEPSAASEPVIEAPKAEAEVAKAPKPAPEAPKVEEEKKGFFGLFKRAKKEEPPPEKPAKPAPSVEMAPPTRKAPEPARTEARIPSEAPPVPAGKDKGKELARMVAEMKPLLSLAREKEVDIGQSKNLIDEAAVAGRERQLDKAIELVQRSKAALMSKIDMQLANEITRLNDEIRVARDFGGDTARASTYVQEIVRARSSGDVEAAYVYVDKVKNELLPITGRYNESKKKVASMKELIGNAELFIVDTKEARSLLVDASKALDMKDFDKLDTLIKAAQEKLYKAIPSRMNEEMKKAKAELIDAKMRNVNITPMITVLKSATNLMKAGDYAQALREMRDFRQMMKAA
jgi:cellobiose-specific phosphotransferase system component IIA/RNA polymerase subunit RPABC4/transcription elongation factor Spt4